MKNIMSIDPGLRSMGIYINNQEGEDVSLTVKTDKDQTEKEIYQIIKTTFVSLIKKYNIKVIFCEDYAFSTFGRSTAGSIMAEIKGMLKTIIYDKELKMNGLILVPIATWKAFHKNLKLPKNKNKKYLKIVNDVFKKNLQTCDEADAYLMLVAMYMIYKGVVTSNTHLKIKKSMEEIGEIWKKKIIGG